MIAMPHGTDWWWVAMVTAYLLQPFVDLWRRRNAGAVLLDLGRWAAVLSLFGALSRSPAASLRSSLPEAWRCMLHSYFWAWSAVPSPQGQDGLSFARPASGPLAD